jgi:septum formation protein
LSFEKARAVAPSHPDALIIGSDQAVDFDGQHLGKPGNRHAAIQQLLDASGRLIDFHTAVCLLTPGQTEHGLHQDRTRVHFRNLSLVEIERYVDAESPLDCAGSFKSEGLGITLFDQIENEDPSALIGLPLIGLASLLRQSGVPLP